MRFAKAPHPSCSGIAPLPVKGLPARAGTGDRADTVAFGRSARRAGPVPPTDNTSYHREHACLCVRAARTQTGSTRRTAHIR